MDISAVMNIHDLAIHKTIRQQADAQARQETLYQQIQAEEAEKKAAIEDKKHLETTGALTNKVDQQEDPQAVKIRIERQVDAQAAKKTTQGTEENGQKSTELREAGTLINIIT